MKSQNVATASGSQPASTPTIRLTSADETARELGLGPYAHPAPAGTHQKETRVIPATLPHEAHFTTDHGDTIARPVLAWDGDGHPLVADERGLRRADFWGNFAYVRQANPAPVVAAVPGGGYLAHYRMDDGTLYASPIVCWLVRADGTVSPVDADGDGLCDDPSETANFDHVSHPDQQPANKPN